MQKPVVFRSGRYNLYGMLHIPDKLKDDEKVPVVVYCHGFTGTKVEAHGIFVKMARLLLKYKIASLRFDFCGCGDSEGEFADTCISDHVKDTYAAIDFAISQHGINEKKIGLIGFSLGGAVAGYVAGRDPRVKALALWAPAEDLVEEAQQLRKDKELKRIVRFKAVDYYGTLLGRRFIREIPNIHPAKEIARFRGSTIILHGTDDDAVPLEHSQRFFDVLKSKGLHVTRHLIEGANHTFAKYAWEQEVLKKTLRFFIKHL